LRSRLRQKKSLANSDFRLGFGPGTPNLSHSCENGAQPDQKGGGPPPPLRRTHESEREAMSPDPEPGLVLRPDPALRIRVSATTVNTLGTDPGIRGTGRNTPATTDPEPDMWATGTTLPLNIRTSPGAEPALCPAGARPA